MVLPLPHPGRVLRYSYLWAREHDGEHEHGSKDRPCIVVLNRHLSDSVQIVTVVAVTHTPPVEATHALEIPAAIKTSLALDGDRSWVILTEVNSFVWPGPDMAIVPRSRPPRFDYGVLPPQFFRKLRDELIALIHAKRVQIVRRTQ